MTPSTMEEAKKNIYHTLGTLGPACISCQTRVALLTFQGNAVPVPLRRLWTAKAFEDKNQNVYSHCGRHFIGVDRDATIGGTGSEEHVVGMEGEAAHRTYFLAHERWGISYVA